MKTFLTILAIFQAGAALHASGYREMHLAAVVLSVAVLGLVAWLERRERGWRCEHCAPDGRCSVCK